MELFSEKIDCNEKELDDVIFTQIYDKLFFYI